MSTNTLVNSNKSDVFRFNHCMIISQSNRVRKVFVEKMRNNELIIPRQCTKSILSLIVLRYKTKVIVQKSSNVNAFY